MKDVKDISELHKGLSDLPKIVKYRDGDEIVDCQLCFYKDEQMWVAAYHCSVYDCHLMCGYGDTAISAINHLRKVLKDWRKHRGEGYVKQ